jgi:hypothetical protein
VTSFSLGQWHAGASRRGLGITIAAVLLMLHWAAPDFRPPEVRAASGDLGPSLSSETGVSQHGNLPRALPRPFAYEAAQSKPQRHDWHAGSKSPAWPASFAPELPPGEALRVIDARIAPPATTPIRAFDARGPPRPI